MHRKGARQTFYAGISHLLLFCFVHVDYGILPRSPLAVLIHSMANKCEMPIIRIMLLIKSSRFGDSFLPIKFRERASNADKVLQQKSSVSWCQFVFRYRHRKWKGASRRSS